VITQENKPEKFVMGVDVGGTKVAAGIVTSAGEIMTQTRVSMIADGDATDGFRAVQAAVDPLFASAPRASIRAMGVCAPGPLDPHLGVVINPPLPGWRAEEIPLLHARFAADAGIAGGAALC
jgi:glucokinase